MKSRVLWRFLCVFVIFLCTSFSLKAQWVRQNFTDSTGLGLSIKSVKFTDANTGYAVGNQYNYIFNQYSGVIYKTVNSGANWTTINILPSLSNLINIEIINTSNIFITCDTARIIRTTNSGVNWTLVSVPSVGNTSFTWNINFINTLTGWISTTSASASQKTFQTSNGGSSWIPVNASQGFTKMKFFDNFNGTAINSLGMWITSNSGTNWYQSVQDSLLKDFVFLNNSTGWLFSKKSVSNSSIKGKSWKTTNGGNNWNILYSSDSSITGLYGAIFFDEMTGYANNFNFQSGILKTTNGGTNWFNPTDLRLTLRPENVPLAFINANTGWFTPNISYYNYNNYSYKTTTGPGNLVNPYFASYSKVQNSNNIRNNISVYGELTEAPETAQSSSSPGMEFPKGSGNYVMYHSGLVLGAKVNGETCVSTGYSTGSFTPGIFNSSGVEVGNSLGEYGLYQIKAGDGAGVGDWDNWPAGQGAPFISGQPQLTGQQTTFLSFTDGVRGGMGDAPPLKAEVKLTSYMFNDELRKDAIYYKFEITNKNSLNWDSAFVSFFADADIGSSVDDRMGCDTTLNLVYVYNGVNTDPGYGSTPPAVGYKLVSSSLPGLKFSSAVPFYNISPTPPNSCETDSYNALGNFFYQKGFNSCGNPYTYNGSDVKFVFTGDPETGTGWNSNFNGDVRFAMNFGPITLASNQSATIIVAAIVARGNNNRNSVTKLKQYAAMLPLDVQSVSTVVPKEFKLNQNYPNPFNPVTKISYSVPKASFMELNVYDISGRLVKNLFSGNQQTGNYEVDFNGESLASGIYICRMNSENYTNAIKMMLVK
jgi:photosystem II stability/assembly factor-like uncharacterized protein